MECSTGGSHVTGHKVIPNIFKQKLYQALTSDHNGMKLGIDYWKITAKNTNMWRQNNKLLKGQIKQFFQERNQRICHVTEKWKHNFPKCIALSINSSRGKVIMMLSYFKDKK